MCVTYFCWEKPAGEGGGGGGVVEGGGGMMREGGGVVEGGGGRVEGVWSGGMWRGQPPSDTFLGRYMGWLGKWEVWERSL